MDRLLGIETEYGIVAEGLNASDWVSESMALIRGVPGPQVSGWNYHGEDPRRDMRGFTVKHLSTNPDDAKFDLPGSKPMSREEERNDRVLANGARFYNDHGHPEYSTPECRMLRDLVAHDKAGERIVWEAAKKRSEQTSRAVTIYKNNTDFHGASYGTHECYLTLRDVLPEMLIAMLLPFFASRCIFAGAGKSGVENISGSEANLFQMSQRADYMAIEASVDTLHNRPLVNTRDEPHATPSRYRRLHVICGDANMSEYATALKTGTTAVVLAMLEKGAEPLLRLRDPVRAARLFSRDITLKQSAERENGTPVTALEIQRIYLDQAHRYLSEETDEDIRWTLAEWENILNVLARDPMEAADRLDWVAKYQLLNEFGIEEKLAWNDPHMQSLDLAYHNIDPEAGLYHALLQAGEMRTLVTEARVQSAITCPPADTRAFLRGLFVERFAASIRAIGWNGVLFRHNEEDLLFDMNPLVEDNVRLLNEEFQVARSLAQVVDLLQPGSEIKRRSGGEENGNAC